MADTDEAWELIAQRDPYWGVLSADEFLGTHLEGDAERRFFESGEAHIARVLDVLRTSIQPGFEPKVALDYGCGVGRLLIPLAKTCQRVVGVDVSATMLDRAREHLSRADLTNVDLHRADDLGSIAVPVDLVHSVLVLQHVPPATGMAILETLVDLLAPGGCGAIQFHFRGSGGRSLRRLRRWRERSSFVNTVVVRALRRPARASLVLMHEYDSTSVLRTLAEHGAPVTLIETTALPSGYTDATVYFQKAR